MVERKSKIVITLQTFLDHLIDINFLIQCNQYSKRIEK
jgi:hypothetical protein